MKPKKIFKYRRAYDLLRSGILAGKYRDGMLPSEDELGRELDAGRNIVRQAMELLVEDGLIIKERGRCARIVPDRLRPAQNQHKLVLLQRFDYLRDDDNPVYGAIITGLLEEAARRGVLLENHYLPPDSAPEYIRRIAEVLSHADGIFSTYMPRNDTPGGIAEILEQHSRVIGLDYVLGAFGRHFVGTDNYEGGRMAANLLAQGGRNHPLLLGVASSYYRYSPMIERTLGFRDGCAQAGLTFSRKQVMIRECLPTSHTIRAVLNDALQQFRQTDAVFCLTDLIAGTAIIELNAMGYNVPDDIAVLGFDGISSPETPAVLTSIRQPVEKIMTAGFDLMEQLLYADAAYRTVTLIRPEHTPGTTV